jgi:hypothetical protein
VTVRPRAAADLPTLVTVLEAQRPASGYPVRWPLPFPAEEFIARRTELAAWVAVDGDTVVGHVALLDVVSESSRALALYRRHGWQVVGRARPPWLPDDREPLVLMALPDEPRSASSAGRRRAPR